MAGEDTQELELDVEIENNDNPTVDDPTSEEGNEEGINQEDEEGSGEDEESSDNEEVVDGKKAGLPHFKAITEKYPKFFKEFPGFRNTYFREQQFSKIFPGIEEAQEAQSSMETLDNFTSSIKSGKIDDLAGTIKSFDELGDDVVDNLADNFMPALQKVNPDAYYRAVGPEIVKIIRSMYNNGVKNGNDNLKNAGLIAAQHFFDDLKVATGEREIDNGSRKNKDPKVDEDRRAFQNERYTTFYNDVVQESNSELDKAIMNGLDPRNSMTPTMRTMVAKEVKAEIDKVLKSDRSYLSQLNSHWKKAEGGNFQTSFKSKIINTYLGRAKEILPSIRAKVRANVLGTRQRSPEDNKTNDTSNRREPKNNTGSGGQQGGRVVDKKKIDPSTIDWSKTTDLDYVKGKITFKNTNGK